MKNLHKLLFIFFSGFVLNCANKQAPVRTESKVNLQSFMGSWYVIASIPTFIEKGAHNAVETYELRADGRIATTFTFFKNSFHGERKSFHPVGTVYDTTSNAVWGMQFIWPIKADYRIVYLSEDKRITVIGRNQRDYVWIMSRDYKISDEKYSKILSMLKSEGYRIEKIVKIPQKWEN